MCWRSSLPPPISVSSFILQQSVQNSSYRTLPGQEVKSEFSGLSGSLGGSRQGDGECEGLCGECWMWSNGPVGVGREEIEVCARG